MQKTIQITVPPAKTEALIAALREQEGLLSLQVQRGSSLHPPGDALLAVLSTPGMSRVMRLLYERRIGLDEGTSVFTGELAGAISPSVRETIGSETSDLSWEEIEMEMGKESNMTANALLLMAIAGAVAAIGIATDTLHVVIGAMVIAPGFEAITRVSLGIATGNEAWRRGLLNVAKGYAALIAGAAVIGLLLVVFGLWPPEESTYLARGELVSYWSTVTPQGVLVSALAGAAGALLIASDRAVLTAGVLISLALIPSATLIGVALATMDLPLLGRSTARWGIDLLLVAGMAIPVFVWHARRIGRRESMI